MSFYSQAAVGVDTAIWIQRETGRCQPGRPLASSAEQAGSVVVAFVVGQGDAGLLKHLLDGWIQLSAALLQLQGPLRPSAAQCQDDF